jgi:hypothetical protein
MSRYGALGEMLRKYRLFSLSFDSQGGQQVKKLPYGTVD